MPPTCCARTDTTMLRPGDAIAPVVGASSVTLKRLHVRQEDHERVFREVALAVDGAADES